MGNKISQPSGHSINNVENQELVMRVLVEEKPSMKPPDTITSSSTNIWPNVKPFMNGGIAGILTYSFGLYAHFLRLKFAAKSDILKLNVGGLIYEAISKSMRLGSFETLQRKVEAGNKRVPLTLYQEACCGVTSGAVTACVVVPMLLALNRVRAGGNRISILQDLYRKCAEEGVFALWKGGRPHANVIILVNVGMMTPYNRCFNYFQGSLGLSGDETVLAAGLVSGFCASACMNPYVHVFKTMRDMKPDACGKYPYSSSLDCVIKILKSRGPIALFTGLPRCFFKLTGEVMMFWFWLEMVLECEEFIGL